MLDADLRRASGADFAKDIRGFHRRQLWQIRRCFDIRGGPTMPAFRAVLEIAIPIFGAVAAVWRWLPSGAINGGLLAVAAGLARALVGRTVLGVLTISVVLTAAFVGKAFVAEATVMLKASAAEAVMSEAVMSEAVVVRALAAKTVTAKAMMLGALVVKAFAAEAVMAEAMMTEAMMPRFLAVEAVMMIEAVPREALLLGTVMLTVMPGKALMIELLMAGTLLVVPLLFGGVVFASMLGARLSVALMARALPGAIGMMGTMHRYCHDVFADFHSDLLFLRLADDREGRRAIFASGAHQDLKLPGIHDLLVVIELQHIVTQEAGRGRRAIGQNTFHHQTEVFGQTELRGEDGGHRGGDDANIGHWFWGRHRRMLEMAGTFGAIRSAVFLVPAFLPGAIGMVEMFMMFAGRSGIRGALTVRGIWGVLPGRAVRIGAMPPMSFALRALSGGGRRRSVWRGGGSRGGRRGRGRRRWRRWLILGDRQRGAHGGSRCQ
jgi:hypothetical protein